MLLLAIALALGAADSAALPLSEIQRLIIARALERRGVERTLQ